MAEGESLVYTGVWTGEMVEEGSEGGIPILWSLVLVSDSPYPSAYGATGQENPAVIHGEWDKRTKEVKLKEILPTGVREYNAHLEDVVKKKKVAHDNDSSAEDSGEDIRFTIIKGTWAWGQRKGRFWCCREKDSESNISGFWLGRALPSSKLADFCIPINPIRWCATILTSTLPHFPSVPTFFGCGFFDDSGDVPGQSLLFYSLRGKFDATNRQIEFTKVYEDHNETEGYNVEYKGVLEEDGTLRGKWNNKKGGSFGKFSCRRQGSSPKQTSAICICDVCSTAIKPGEVRWSCATCPSLWFCCSSCAREDLSKLHPHTLSPEGMHYQDTAQGTCCAEIVLDSFTRFAKRELVGWRTDPKEKVFRWLTYEDVFWHTKQMLFGMRELGIKPGEFVFICADLSVAYLAVILSTIMHGLVLLPIHGCLGQDEIKYIVNKTNPTLCFVSTQYRMKVEQAFAEVASGKAIGVEITSGKLEKANEETTPPQSQSPPKQSSGAFKQIMSLDELKALGSGNKRKDSTIPTTTTSSTTTTEEKKEEEIKVEQRKKDDVAAILFTSGSTGIPKGAIFTEDLMRPSEGVANVQPFIRVDFQAYDPSFSLSVLQTMMCGGSRLFSLSLDTILEDFQIGRPTHIGATPIFWNGLYQEFLVRLSKEVRINDAEPPNKRKPRADLSNRVAGQIRAMLGNRLIVATSGGAPISPEVLTFLKTKLRLDIIDLYGSRETGGITRDGVVYPGINVKLRDVPELGYFSTSVPPQGEICVHSPRLISGYWNEEAITADTFVEIDGKKYYRTGDIGEMHETIESNGKKVITTTRLKVIDRVSAMVKLSSGEWISPGNIETVLENSPWVSQCLILGSPTYPFTVAVVVPSLLLHSFWKSPRDPTVIARAKSQLLHEIRLWGVHHHLRPLQIPQNIYLESTPWTSENGFLTGTEKKRRKLLQAHYAEIQKSLYQQLDHLDVGTEMLSSASSPLSKEFLELLKSILPIVPDLSGADTLGSIGGDSLSAARLCNSLRDKGVEVQLANIFDYSLSHLSQLLSQASTSIALPMSNFLSINWAAETTLPAHLKLGTNKPGPHVLLTGATGFLGPVLLAEALKQYPPEVKVYCLIRAKGDEQAAIRLKADMETALVWDPSKRGQIVVLAGDISKPKLGLGEEMYNKLTNNEVGIVIHNAAWVNMALPYSALKSTNVGGTLSIIQFALDAGGARVHFVSSVAAIPASAPFDALPSLATTSDLDKRDGYGQTKIVAEILLSKANSTFGLPIQISRPSAISSHTVTGFTNRHDFHTLLIGRGMVHVAGGSVRDTTVVLHWVPVDFVARGIVLLTRSNPVSQHIYNIVAEGPLLREVIDVVVAILKEKRSDFKFEALSPAQWSSKVEAKITHELSALYPLKEQFVKYAWYGVPTRTNEMASSTRKILQMEGIDWCKISNEEISKMVKYCITNNIL